MNDGNVYDSFGLMAGTSMDGIDVAWVKTDGKDYTELMGFMTVPYQDATVEAIRAVFNRRHRDEETDLTEKLVTDDHINAVEVAIKEFGHSADIIGFHGQTISHDPAQRFTWQIGDSQRLANSTGIQIIGDMRVADVQAGGQGAPLLPLCHRAFASEFEKPMAILNLGGVGNVTWLGEERHDIVAFDTGPANALINDLVKEKTGEEYDSDGKLAAAGTVHQDMVDDWLTNEYFSRPVPKSLDRNAWPVKRAYDLSLEDAVATLTAFTVQSVAKSFEYLPGKPKTVYVCGGGRHNKYIMAELSKALSCPVESVRKLDWNGDAVEAKGFAYLAVRSLLGLSITLPTTTGAPEPMTGGNTYNPSSGSDTGALRPAITK